MAAAVTFLMLTVTVGIERTVGELQPVPWLLLYQPECSAAVDVGVAGCGAAAPWQRGRL